MLKYVFLTASAITLAAGLILPAPAQQAKPHATALPQSLKSVEDFAGIADQRQRSLALFQEIGKVVTHPRCVNCHPRGDSPLQGDDGHLHQPPVQRGEADFGVAGMHCNTCHGTQNVAFLAKPGSIPGHEPWMLAPKTMAWEGKSLGEICTQLKDPARNGNRSLAEIQDHMANDGLVGWGWHPGPGRTPVPGTQKQFGELVKAWIDSGAACPAG
ncbi:hypothetical protein SAMN06265365_10330 [Tistlia consotensis]|uniref:Isoquinoline 1-oxidoreductase subunit n=1 Tax=Tistlia consotensis USBA 355 TaxID=560819 RepID=A0A1Y6BPN9_9PROT|nr:hypothetical protein [Tistlia consotensis]SMF18881.1 hypothetical protein SAMN05428998_106195 [Tistlia consotensis USBA 355]SNR39343.1 hypothetical protein SAMN06265365_10330 [Tistlia consotensis]